MLRLIKRLFFLLLVASSLLVLTGWWGGQHYINQPLSIDANERLILVPPGSTVIGLAKKLAVDEVLSKPDIFILYARLTQQTEILSGEYRLVPADTPKTLLQKLISGEVVQYQVTFPEGLTFKEWQSLAGKHPKLAESVENLDVEALLSDLELTHPEGWFFPETYQFTASESFSDILLRAYGKMKSVLDTEWGNREPSLPYKNAYEALIMASIVERETGMSSERQQIAGVFVRRLIKGMRLQTDPTVIYGLGDRYKGNLKRRHLTEKTAYNTYQIPALPPTPIAMPGQAAINAALHPAQGKALYFVARGDGSHYFSSNLREHQQAVRKYQLNRQTDYRSSPVKQ